MFRWKKQTDYSKIQCYLSNLIMEPITILLVKSAESLHLYICFMLFNSKDKCFH